RPGRRGRGRLRCGRTAHWVAVRARSRGEAEHGILPAMAYQPGSELEPEILARIARGALPETVAAEVTSIGALVREIQERFLPPLGVFPAERLEVEAIAAALREELGDGIEVSPAASKCCRARLEGVPSSGLREPLSRISKRLRALGTHPRVVAVDAQEPPGDDLLVALTVEIPLENELRAHGRGEYRPLEMRGQVDLRRSDLETRDIVC